MSFQIEVDGWYIDADVDECHDAYGTGDSPTLYTVEFHTIVDEEGNEVKSNDLSERILDWLEDQVIEAYTG